MKKFPILAALAVFLCLSHAASAADAYQTQDAFIRETPMKIAAAYVTITNPTDKADTLQSADASWAKRIELHSVTTDNKGVMAMKKIDSMTLAAKGKLELSPGGYHLMIFDVSKKLVAGEKQDITLHFKHAGVMKVSFTVQPISYNGHQAMKNMKTMAHDKMQGMAHDMTMTK